MSQSQFELEGMTWEEAGEALRETDYVVVPIGSNEQHALHLSLQTDIAMAYEVAKRVVERSKPDLKIVIAPKVPYGVSEHHMHFPGTISLKHETLLAVVSDVCESLKRHGVKNIVLMNGHGGNRAILDVAATKLQRELDVNILVVNWWTLASDITKREVKSERWGHSCEVETSMAMHLIPETVRVERTRKPTVRPRHIDLKPLGYEERFSPSPVRYWEDLTDTGALGDPAQASEDFGARLVDTIVERLVYSLKSFKKKHQDDFPA
ncbi:MAG: creatininase family protein [Candidatus Bathyarchaeia archaeon]